MANEFNEGTFRIEVLEGEGPAVIDFWAPWCGPCRMMTPVIDAMSQKYDGQVTIAKVNVDENQKLAGEYNIMSIPSILFFKDGQLVHTAMGAMREADLENLIKEHLL